VADGDGAEDGGRVKERNYLREVTVLSLGVLGLLAAPFALFWLFLWAACVFGKECV
jgi:hypothetical protein